MDPLARLEVRVLLGELLVGARPVEEIERDFIRLVGDEKARSYNIGINDSEHIWRKS